MLAIDGIMSFLQLMVVQNAHKNMCFSPTRLCSRWWNRKTLEDSFKFSIFLCVRIKINSHWQ